MLVHRRALTLLPPPSAWKLSLSRGERVSRLQLPGCLDAAFKVSHLALDVSEPRWPFGFLQRLDRLPGVVPFLFANLGFGET